MLELHPPLTTCCHFLTPKEYEVLTGKFSTLHCLYVNYFIFISYRKIWGFLFVKSDPLLPFVNPHELWGKEFN